MKLIAGKDREDLDELVKQLRAHGQGGSSSALTAAMGKFGVMTMHDLSLRLADMLLSLEVKAYGGGGPGNVGYACGRNGRRTEIQLPNGTILAGGGGGTCAGGHVWVMATGACSVGEVCSRCGISRGRIDGGAHG